MPLKVQYPLPLVGLEPYQLGVQIRAKKKKKKKRQKIANVIVAYVLC